MPPGGTWFRGVPLGRASAGVCARVWRDDGGAKAWCQPGAQCLGLCCVSLGLLRLVCLSLYVYALC